MVVLAVLLISWAILRLAGKFGARRLATWRDSGRIALALMLLFTAAAHFNSNRQDLVRMTPEWVPQPELAVTLTGILEIAGALGILIPQTRSVAGICLCLLFAAMFLANVRADREQLTIAGNPATPLLIRTPMQALFIWLAWWSTRQPSHQSERSSDLLSRRRAV
jgi:uncharacterized membrane protein